MRIFYIANDDFSEVGHPAHTLKSLYQGNPDQVVLLTQPQSPDFKKNLPLTCTLVEFLPTSEEGRNCAPLVLGAQIADQLLVKNITADDLIVLKMPYPYLLLSVVYALSLSRVSISNPKLSVLISQTDDGYTYEQIRYSDCFKVIANLPARLRDRIALLHEREALRQHWYVAFPSLRMGVCGYVTEWFQTVSYEVIKPNQHHLTYLGKAREEKGFNTLAEVLSTGAIKTAINIHIDTNLNHMTEEYHEAMRCYMDCCSRQPSIQLVHQLRDNSYQSAFHPNSIALMLYSSEYRLRGSGVLQECAAVGMHIIAYEDLGFHYDYPENVWTVTRTENTESLGHEIQSRVDQITAGERRPTPNVLTAKAFRALLLHPNV